MTAQDRQPRIVWQESAATDDKRSSPTADVLSTTASTAPTVAFSPLFQDIYRRSEDDGLAQAQQVFLAGCGLPQRWLQRPAPSTAPFIVLECGFGLGTNFLATWLAWEQACKAAHNVPPLHYVACEAYPVRSDDLQRALAATAAAATAAAPDAGAQAKVQALCRAFWGLTPGIHPVYLGVDAPKLTLLIGPAATLLQDYELLADAVYLDGFNPSRNPDMWSLDLIRCLKQKSRTDARWATWSVAASLRENLDLAGVAWQKVPGLPPKRHRLQAWIRADYRDRNASTPTTAQPRKPILILGAGLAGAASAYALAQRGFTVQVWDSAARAAAGASGIPVGLCAPLIHSHEDVMTRLVRTGLRSAMNSLMQLTEQGRLQAGQDYALVNVEERCVADKHCHAAQALAADCPHFGDWTQSGQNTLRHIRAAWIKPAAWIAALLQDPLITLTLNHTVRDVQQLHRLQQSGEYAAIVLANGVGSGALSPTPLPYLQAIRGQTSWARHHDHAAASPAWRQAQALNGHGYCIPWVADAAGAFWCAGSSYVRDDFAQTLRDAEHQIVAQKLQRLAPEYWTQLAPYFAPITSATQSEDEDEAKLGAGPAAGTGSIDHQGPVLQGYSGIRCYSRGRLPLVGPLSTTAKTPANAAPLYICTGLASRGLSFATVCGELLACHVMHGLGHSVSIWPLASSLVERMRPD